MPYNIPDAVLEMLDEYNPSWRDEFPTEREALEYYGLNAMLEWHEAGEQPFAELDFND